MMMKLSNNVVLDKIVIKFWTQFCDLIIIEMMMNNALYVHT